MPYKDQLTQREFQKKHYADNKEMYKQRLAARKKENGDYIKLVRSSGCKICGYNKCDAALDFHHLDGNEKERGIARAKKDFCLETLKKEIAKCIVVCANCHREIHAGVVKLEETHQT